MEDTFAIKVRKAGQKRFRFLGRNGSLTMLRVHACLYDTHDDAQRTVDLSAPLNPAMEWKVVRTNA